MRTAGQRSKANPSLALTSKPLSSSPNAAVAAVWPPRCSDAFRPFVVAMPAITLSESLSVTARVTDSCVADDPARDRQREYYGSARIRDRVADCLVERGRQ